MTLSDLVNKLLPSRNAREKERCSRSENPFTGFFLRADLPKNLARADEKPALANPLAYTARLRQEEIRLLVLYPSSHHGQDIRLSTWIRTLDDADDDFCALSYVWGDPSKTAPVYVDGHEFRATENLVSVLKHIRDMLREDEVIVLWVDAISINQRDIEERNAQVASMMLTYEKAAFVACWLGADHEEGLAYLNELGRFATARDENPTSLSMQRPKIEGVKHVKGRNGEIKAAAHLVNHPYWSRVWTVQEYSSPRPGVFICGSSWMDKSVFSPALKLFIQSLHLFRRIAERNGQPVAAVDLAVQVTGQIIHRHQLAYVRSSPSVRAEVFGLYWLLARFRPLNSSDPRDKVYAPLAMSNQSVTDMLPIDYEISMTDLYIRTAECLLQNKDWPLAILEACRYADEYALPSWVPDWTILPRRLLSQNISTGEQTVCASRGTFAPSTSPVYSVPAEDRHCLVLEGIPVDTLQRAWPALYQRDMLDMAEITIDKADAQGQYVGTDETLATAYRKTCNPTFSGPNEIEANDRLVLVTREEWRVDSKIMTRLNRRRLAHTIRGLIALVPAEAEPDDTVWLVRGGNMFYILRPESSNRHILIGEAYVHGLMNGEITSMRDLCSGGLPKSERIVLM
jgi:hypothetical protein